MQYPLKYWARGRCGGAPTVRLDGNPDTTVRDQSTAPGTISTVQERPCNSAVSLFDGDSRRS